MGWGCISPLLCFGTGWGHVGRLPALKWVGAMLVDFVPRSKLGTCWMTTCFEVGWGHTGRLRALKQVGAMLADCVL